MKKLLAVAVALSLAGVAQADDKKYLSCKRPKADVFPLIISALSEKWTITNTSETMFMITAQKEDVKGKLWGNALVGMQNVVVTVMVKDGPDGGSLVDMKATRGRSGDAQSNLLKYLPAGECVEFKPPKEK